MKLEYFLGSRSYVSESSGSNIAVFTVLSEAIGVSGWLE